MEKLRIIWDYLALHKHEIVWAFIAAAVLESLRFNSFIGRGIRFLKNKLAEQSVERLQARIVGLDKYRDSLKTYLVSDKAHYLVTLRALIAILMFMAIGAVLIMLGR